jgi:hypothetical protein
VPVIRLSRSLCTIQNRLDIEHDGELLMRGLSQTEAAAILSRFEVENPRKLVEHVLVWGTLDILRHGLPEAVMH